MRRILEGFRLDKVDEPCIEPKQKQWQELPRKSINQMNWKHICFTCHATWTLGHICGDNMGKNLLHPSGVRDTKTNIVEYKKELVIAKNLDHQIEEIVMIHMKMIMVSLKF